MSAGGLGEVETQGALLFTGEDPLVLERLQTLVNEGLLS